MNCIKIKKILSLYIDKRLNSETTILIEKHIAECNDCRNEYQIMLNNDEKLKQTEDITVSLAFSYKLMQRIQNKDCPDLPVLSPERIFIFNSIRKLAAVCAIIIIISVSISYKYATNIETTKIPAEERMFNIGAESGLLKHPELPEPIFYLAAGKGVK